MSNLKIVFLSDWLTNPYKELLIQHLEKENVTASELYWSIFFIHKVVSQGVPDVLHFHTIHPFLIGKTTLSRRTKLYLFSGQLFLLRLLGTRVVWTVHEWNNKLGNKRANITSGQAAFLGKFFHVIITHCKTTQQDIARVFKLERTQKVVVIPHGNYIGYYPNHISSVEARQRLNIANEDTVFLLFGDIYRYKGVLESIRAFKQINNHQATLLIAGLPREDRLEAEILETIDNHHKVVFLPERVPNEEVQLVMNACDYVLMPYNVFTTSGVAILAMSFGKACIAPNIGFFKDVLDAPGAFLYESASKNGLSEAIKNAIRAKQQAITMGQYNLRVAQQWDWQTIALKTTSVYH